MEFLARLRTQLLPPSLAFASGWLHAQRHLNVEVRYLKTIMIMYGMYFRFFFHPEAVLLIKYGKSSKIAFIIVKL